MQVADVLAETGPRPEALTLEITESMLLEDSDALAGELVRLKALNVRLAMDDFGAAGGGRPPLPRVGRHHGRDLPAAHRTLRHLGPTARPA